MVHMLGDISNSPTSNYWIIAIILILLHFIVSNFLNFFCINIANQFSKLCGANKPSTVQNLI